MPQSLFLPFDPTKPVSANDVGGAVSPQVAEAMAQGARTRAGADLGLGITGIAGPSGGSPEKPVGLVYLALATADGVHVIERRLPGDRSLIQDGATAAGLDLIRRLRSSTEL